MIRDAGYGPQNAVSMEVRQIKSLMDFMDDDELEQKGFNPYHIALARGYDIPELPGREYVEPMNLTDEERGSLMTMGDAGSMSGMGQGLFDEEYMRMLMQRMRGGAGPSLYNPGMNFQGGM